MAISGGASKGAYEAGLNWGLLKVLQNFEEIDPVLGGQGRAVDAASFSGASAGGINTLLSGLGWCSLPESKGGLPNRIESNIFRDVWLIPDVNRLLPPTADSHYYRSDDALLSRHDLLEASRLLRESWNKPFFRQDCRVPLGVTVTRVIPEKLRVRSVEVQNQRLFIPFEARTQNDGTLGFYFDPKDYPGMADPDMILMPRPHNASPYSVNDQRIEDAVLTSAAYPGGFGRRRLQYCRLLGYTATEEASPKAHETTRATEATLVCPENYELALAEFADGGLFDNLPLGLARRLAERHKHATDNPLPVTYVYMDPNRLRYKVPLPPDTSACASDNPPEACRIMEYSFLTEHGLMLGALGTARRYELFRELTSDYWALNLAQLSYELADELKKSRTRTNCQKELPYVSANLSCSESVRRAGALLELAYSRSPLPITAPYSAEKLAKAGIVRNCRYPKKDSARHSQAECEINIARYRHRLANALLKITEEKSKISSALEENLYSSKVSMHNDRILRVTSRGAPITGTLLSAFGAFLDRKFREYDYYVGIYDAVIAATETLCGLQFSEQYQQREFKQCRNALAHRIFTALAVQTDPRGRYVFARLAQWEFSQQNTLRFAYDPMPAEDRDMRIIFDGLIQALEAGEQSDAAKQSAFFTEDTFFRHLLNERFTPTPTEDGSQPLLAQIIADPTTWSSELIRRMTTRLVYLEQQAEKIYAAREPDPAKRRTSNTTLMGVTALSLQAATFKYPDFTFSPSTAPDRWGWRYLIPYEAALDLVEGDVIFTWQPTWAMSNKDLLGIRASLGFAGGMIESSDNVTREDYGALGLGYSRRTGSGKLSSWGITPAWYHTWNKPELGEQDTFGGDIHVGFLEDRLRIGLGSRDFSEASDTWFLAIGLTDIPGLSYWLTR